MSHVENYRAEWGFGEQDTVLCERCGRRADHFHHIRFRSHGGGDEVANIIAVCLKCHEWAHSSQENAEKMLTFKRRKG